MKAKDIIQVRQFDAGVSWIFAQVIALNDDGSPLVEVRHPGNREHGVQKIVDKSDCRTSDDVQKLLDMAKEHSALSRIRAVQKLSEVDDWVDYANNATDDKQRRIGYGSLHHDQGHEGQHPLVHHYQAQLDKFKELAK